MDRNISKEDKLKQYRFGDDKETSEFDKWLSSNCVKATSLEEVRRILRHIKSPLKKVVND